MTIKLGKRGDTIVEVLLAIAISSFALTAGYASVDNSLITERQAQDRSEAVQMVQSQVETLNDLYNAGSSDIVAAVKSDRPFCIDNTTREYDAAPTGCNFSPLSISPTHPTGYIDASISPAPYYTITMINSSNSITSPSFPVVQVTVNAKWINAGGGTPDSMTVVYRLN
ncbi:MAG TPA: hypothetical protein VMR18_04760 [Candidatus Saccharimonadales bacterium]|jgi:type II secretory pathway pseudopilin PulG|nr:hypothetical protein [Candidatus Saccharimonadales bacterium]